MYTVNEEVFTRDQLQHLLSGIDNARIGLIGDLCLDMYWLADMKLSELSRETPHYPLPVIEERFSPGGAGNVACNIAALSPQKLLVMGVVGNDWRGDLLLNALQRQTIDCSYIIRSSERITNAYLKPLRRGISDVIYEDPRLDFESREPLSPTLENRLLQFLEQAGEILDVICVSDQLRYGCITPAIRARLSEMGNAGKTIIVDSRDHCADYHHVILKPNEIEAVRAFGNGSEQTLEELSALAQHIARQSGTTALMTLGDKGCFVASSGSVTQCPACSVEPPIDFCGAGDTFLAGFGTLLAAGASPLAAARVANLCSSVTIRKIGTTGTASREEILLSLTL